MHAATKSLFLSPHNDDEVLFGAYTIMRERPLVVTCFRSFVQESVYGITYRQREQETLLATDILGCDWIQWEHPDSGPDWSAVEKDLRLLGEFERVYAPAREPYNGHPQHDTLGDMADFIWPDHVTHYTTYQMRPIRRTTGQEVIPEPTWVLTKLRAMACYPSQILNDDPPVHWMGELKEFYA